MGTYANHEIKTTLEVKLCWILGLTRKILLYIQTKFI